MNDVWSTPDGKRWTCETRSAPWRERFGHSLTVFKGKLWVMGGYHREKFEGFWGAYNDIWCSTNGTTWSLVTERAPWSPRRYHQAVVFNGKLWVINGEENESHPRTDMWNSDDGSSWSLVTAKTPWVANGPFAATVKCWGIPGPNMPPSYSLYVIAGTGRKSSMGIELDENGLWRSDDGVRWDQVSDALPFHYSSFVSICWDRWLYCFGGRKVLSQRSEDFAQVWVSDFTRECAMTTCCAPWGERAFMSALVFKNDMFVMGGVRDTTPTNDVWRSSDGEKWVRMEREKP